jgi:hypothetical protein
MALAIMLVLAAQATLPTSASDPLRTSGCCGSVVISTSWGILLLQLCEGAYLRVYAERLCPPQKRWPHHGSIFSLELTNATEDA